MNSYFISIILIVQLFIFIGLSGSSWLWAVIILFPIFVGWRFRLINIASMLIGGFMLVMGYIMSGGRIAIGDIIVFIYLSLLLRIIGNILGVNMGTVKNTSPYVIFSLLAAIIGTIAISFLMP